MAALNFPTMPAGDMSNNMQAWRSYFTMMTEQLAYGFGNISDENYSADFKNQYTLIKNAASEIGSVTARLGNLASLSELNQLMDAVDGKTSVYFADEQPSNPVVGDLWQDTSVTPRKTWRYVSAEEGWSDITSDLLSAALNAAGDAQATADGKVDFYWQVDEPTSVKVGDFWIKKEEGNQTVRWNGSMWESTDNELLASLERDASGNLVIKSTDGRYKAVHTPTGIVFYQSDAWMGEFSNNQLSVARASVHDQFTMGTTTKGFYDFILTNDGLPRLSVKYRGPA